MILWWRFLFKFFTGLLNLVTTMATWWMLPDVLMRKSIWWNHKLPLFLNCFLGDTFGQFLSFIQSKTPTSHPCFQHVIYCSVTIKLCFKLCLGGWALPLGAYCFVSQHRFPFCSCFVVFPGRRASPLSFFESEGFWGRNLTPNLGWHL